MSKNRAVILEKNKNSITVLTGDGVFQTMKYKGAVEIGQEIQLPAPSRAPLWRIGASIAAVFLLTFMGIFGWNAFQPRTAVAMISLDINPSLQLTVDQKGEVLDLESLNSDAEQMIAGLSLKGKTWGEALNEIIKRSVDLNYLNEEESWVVVGYSSVTPNKKELSDKPINTEAISKQVQEAVHEHGLKPSVAVYELTSEQKKQAQETGLSLGEYALADTAQKAGIEVEPKALKEKEERTRLLEIPEIQEQMRKDKRIIETMSFFLGQDASQGNMKNSKNKKDKGEDKDRTGKPSKNNGNNQDRENNKKEQSGNDIGNQNRDNNSGSSSKWNGAGKANDQGEDKDNKFNKTNSRGTNDRENNKDTDKGKSGEKERERSSNKSESNRQYKPADKANESSNQDIKKNINHKMDQNSKNNSPNYWGFQNILRMTYGQRT
ncbi:hypothetical protein Desde_4072 [Desulfitobacterium dehalogenans ATCC 51507]|uniref:RsgI N-terminal anti-sigma domain-containing protein n=1 Tax=Desulfitobacterium dehalogenans (strain ATCC 51507 / DSM 9161 / JW/IU-DC1) TaxID=756499 RepID=I4AEE8_DESDJ|nr:anti-sigma factor domain-containing protein [Desulfitobacterium dehalogenans]AFM02333.1 hypothetical protein Desde_4072 [Desulfitobacterium dehalogenans ATCC 51507]